MNYNILNCIQAQNPTDFCLVSWAILVSLLVRKKKKKTQKEGLETHIAPKHVVGVGCDVSCQTEITDFCHPAMSQQNVSGCKIPVDTLHIQAHTHTYTGQDTQGNKQRRVLSTAAQKLILSVQNKSNQQMR